MAEFDTGYIIYNFLSVCLFKYGSILNHFWVIWHWRISRPWC